MKKPKNDLHVTKLTPGHLGPESIAPLYCFKVRRLGAFRWEARLYRRYCDPNECKFHAIYQFTGWSHPAFTQKKAVEMAESYLQTL